MNEHLKSSIRRRRWHRDVEEIFGRTCVESVKGGASICAFDSSTTVACVSLLDDL